MNPTFDAELGVLVDYLIDFKILLKKRGKKDIAGYGKLDSRKIEQVAFIQKLSIDLRATANPIGLR